MKNSIFSFLVVVPYMVLQFWGGYTGVICVVLSYV